MKFYVGVTDFDWYTQLSNMDCDEVNFWKPGTSHFKALEPNDLFLFKLHAPRNYIVGGGFFVRFTLLPVSLAWDAFGQKNGTITFQELHKRLMMYRQRNGISEGIAMMGCTILTEPFFFREEDWIPVPSNWNNSIVQGKTYTTDEPIGLDLYRQVNERLQSISRPSILADDPRYSESLTKHRLGQGGFRISVSEAYNRRCAITGEKTFPVLEAAHIKPYAANGPHETNNGILLRSDFHTLFDNGYMTITPDLHVEISKRLHEDYGNGKDYYKYHGEKMLIIPEKTIDLPSKEFLEWHNANVYLG